MSAPFFIDAEDLHAALMGENPPVLFDVRRPEIVAASGRLLPGARLADPGDGPGPMTDIGRSRPVVVACAHGHNRSQRVAAHLREQGFGASALAGGYEAWEGVGLPTVHRMAGPVTVGEAPTRWVTRRGPRIDRVACPWLITRFLDPRARFLFVDPGQVLAVAADEGAVAFDCPGAPFEHCGELCSFDGLLGAFGLADYPHLSALATIVRGSDTNRLDLAPECAGLLAVALGLSARLRDDDHAVLRHGFVVYDALLSFLRGTRGERHLSTPSAGRAA